MEIIDKDLKIVLGQLIRVKNLNRRLHENEIYVSLQVKNEDKSGERCILFTETEISDMEKISGKFLELLQYGYVYKCVLGKRETNIIRVKNAAGEDKFLRVSNSQLKRAEKRAELNKEDLTEKSFFSNLFD